MPPEEIPSQDISPEKTPNRGFYRTPTIHEIHKLNHIPPEEIPSQDISPEKTLNRGFYRAPTLHETFTYKLLMRNLNNSSCYKTN